jgi:hypothetical protein
MGFDIVRWGASYKSLVDICLLGVREFKLETSDKLDRQDANSCKRHKHPELSGLSLNSIVEKSHSS